MPAVIMLLPTWELVPSIISGFAIVLSCIEKSPPISMVGTKRLWYKIHRYPCLCQCGTTSSRILNISHFPISKHLAGDSPQLTFHIAALLRMQAKINEYWLDDAYDSFLNHADIWYKLKAEPLISLPVDTVINKEREFWENRSLDKQVMEARQLKTHENRW